MNKLPNKTYLQKATLDKEFGFVIIKLLNSPRAYFLQVRGFCMQKEYIKILENLKGKKAGVFIDEGNMFYSQKDSGWKVHWQKVLDLLNGFVDIKIARYYMGMPVKNTATYEMNVLIKRRLEKEGFEIITKPLKKIYLNQQKSEFKNKCNFDVEITIDAIRNLDKIDLVILGSGDCDFIALKNDVLQYSADKNFIFLCFEHNVSWEVLTNYHIFLEDIKDLIEYLPRQKLAMFYTQHNNNEVASTKGRGPFNLIYYEACLNEQDARAREKYLKSGMGKRYLRERLKRFLFLTG